MNFRQSLEVGLSNEELLDSFFAPKYQRIDKLHGDEQLAGCDRRFYLPNRNFTVEYKADLKASQTGNIFVELMHYRPCDGLIWCGWGMSCKADYLALYLPGLNECFWLNPAKLRGMLLEWNSKFPKASFFGQGKPGKPDFYTQGIKVPVAEVRAIALRIYTINQVNHE